MMERRSGLTLHFERLLSASPDKVFAACVEPSRLAEWWGPSGFTSPSIELDVWTGGSYRIAMQPPEGELFHLRGTFLEVDRPRRLVYTFEWEEPDPDDQETVVTLTFRAAGARHRAGPRSGAIRDRGEARAARGGLDRESRPARAPRHAKSLTQPLPEPFENIGESHVRGHILGIPFARVASRPAPHTPRPSRRRGTAVRPAVA